ncbi:MAG: hypothetical protein QXZ43_01845 [Candidatus Aenigmatarchaeota archaeon]
MINRKNKTITLQDDFLEKSTEFAKKMKWSYSTLVTVSVEHFMKNFKGNFDEIDKKTD